MFEQIRNLIEEHTTVILHRHKNPDGDALGCQIGLWYLLKENYPAKEIYIVGDMTPRYAFIAGREMDVIGDKAYKDALAIVLDTSAKNLISDERYTFAKVTARIDHHIFVEQIASHEVTDTSFESCCGMIAAMALECGWKLSPAAAKALYTGMITDSGRFRYDSVSSKTFRMASYLMEAKFDTGDIYRNLYADDLFFIQLRAKYALKIQTTKQGVAYIYTSKEEAQSYGVDTFTLSRGMVNVMSEIRGIHSWVNFTEAEEGVLCEIRSNTYNINPIAVKYGGGGHQKASGATLKDREEAMALLEEICALGETSL
ncbi:MAG: bifunctional oligoribonuclease/PAP phosphatase NrnA [Clostridia bacterium]|mgnify:CR=1 FL=1|nr:bifunctional oligoribonuclease/PAP phosphatase NrnA [Clostridia bacterium]